MDVLKMVKIIKNKGPRKKEGSISSGGPYRTCPLARRPVRIILFKRLPSLFFLIFRSFFNYLSYPSFPFFPFFNCVVDSIALLKGKKNHRVRESFEAGYLEFLYRFPYDVEGL